MSHGKSGGVSLRHYPMGALGLWVSPQGIIESQNGYSGEGP